MKIQFKLPVKFQNNLAWKQKVKSEPISKAVREDNTTKRILNQSESIAPQSTVTFKWEPVRRAEDAWAEDARAEDLRAEDARAEVS